MLIRQEWDDQNLTFGQNVYNSVPVLDRTDWVGSIILFLYISVENIELLYELWEISLDDSKYLAARKHFNLLRNQTLINEKSHRNHTLTQKLLSIGETASKVIANAGGDNFDSNAGWQIAPRLKEIAEQMNNKEFEDKCWKLLIRKDS